MGIKSTARSLLGFVRSRLASILHPPHGPYVPDLSDASFIVSLLPLSDFLMAAKANAASGDHVLARQRVVAHFLGRRSPRFFCEPSEVSALAARVETERPLWVAALHARVEDDLEVGLRIVATRGMPLSARFDWSNIPTGPGADDLYCVQPHRFGFMPRLALAAHYGMPTPPVIAKLLDSWIDTAEAGYSMCYLSPLVVLYRVLALSWTFTFIAGLRSSDQFLMNDMLFTMLKILWSDTEYLKNTIGDSYPNNHLLADGFAGWYYGTLFPEFPSAEGSRIKGEKIFLNEMRRQFYEDGANFEHSMHYHELGCEMALGYLLLSRRNGIEPNGDIVERLSHMLGFQAALSGPEAVPLSVGDSTEDPLFPLDALHGWASGAIRECYRALFDPNIDAAPDSDLTVERAYWLLGGGLAENITTSTTKAARLPTAFDQGGFYVLSDIGQRARLVFRSGPSGDMALSAGHAHADLLSIYLSVGGIPLIVNSGTYTYRLKSADWSPMEPDWRSYFAGPESHNGLMLGADPYGAMSGDFRNRDVPCRVECRRNTKSPGLIWHEFEITQENVATGYRRGVIHIDGHYWVVYDLVPGSAQTQCGSIGLQLAYGSKANVKDERTVDITVGNVGCRVGLSKGFQDPCLLIGSTKPLAGWVSPRYGDIRPAPQLRARITAESGPCAFVLQAAFEKTANCSITAGMTGDTWIGLQMVVNDFVDVLLIRTSNGDPPMAAWDIEFDGTLLWLRTLNGEVTDYRSIGGELRYQGEVICAVS